MKNLMKKFAIMSILIGSLTFAPNVNEFVNIPSACAEVQTYVGVGACIVDDTGTAKNLGKRKAALLAQRNAAEQACSFIINNRTEFTSHHITENDFPTNKTIKLQSVITKYEITPLNDGSDQVKIVATATAKIDLDETAKVLLEILHKQRMAEGNELSSKGNYNEAINLYNDAVEFNSKSAEAYNNRGCAYINLKDYDKAMSDCSKAIEIKPDYAAAYYNRGNVYANLSDYNHAVDDLSKAIELESNNANAYKLRGECLQKMSEEIKARAQADFDKAKALSDK